MDNINIVLRKNGCQLELECDKKFVGSQYDNLVKQFVFARPQEYGSDDLRLLFRDEKMEFLPVSLGMENTFKIVNALTQTKKLYLQVAFEREGEIIVHSNILDFNLRSSIKGGEIPVASWPSPVRRLFDSAVCDISYEKNVLSFFGLEGGLLNQLDIGERIQGEPGPQGEKGDPGPQGESGENPELLALVERLNQDVDLLNAQTLSNAQGLFLHGASPEAHTDIRAELDTLRAGIQLETGTWPAEVRYNGGTASGTVSPATSVLSKYSVFGDLVLIEFSANVSKEVLSSTNFTSLRICGFPFTFANPIRVPVGRIQLKPDVFTSRGYYTTPIIDIASGDTGTGFFLASWAITKTELNLDTTIGGANIGLSFRFVARRAE